MLDKKAYTEAFYIINTMPNEMKSKIPNDVIDNIKSKMDNDYKFNIENDDFENVELLEDTEKILSVLYTDYLSTNEEKEVILNMEKLLKKSKDKNVKDNINKNNLNIKINDVFENVHDRNIDVEDIEKDIDKNNKLINMSFREWIKNLFNKFLAFFKNKE